VKGTLTDGGLQESGGAESRQNILTLAPVLNCIEPAWLINESFQASDRRAVSSSTDVAFACTATTSEVICVSESHREPDTVGYFNYNQSRIYSARRAPIRTSTFFCMDSDYDKDTQLPLPFKSNRSILRA